MFALCKGTLTHTLRLTDGKNVWQSFKHSKCFPYTKKSNLWKCGYSSAGSPTQTGTVFLVLSVISCLTWAELIHFYIALWFIKYNGDFTVIPSVRQTFFSWILFNSATVIKFSRLNKCAVLFLLFLTHSDSKCSLTKGISYANVLNSPSSRNYIFFPTWASLKDVNHQNR